MNATMLTSGVGLPISMPEELTSISVVTMVTDLWQTKDIMTTQTIEEYDEDELTAYKKFRTANRLYFYPFCLFVGTIGNIFSFVIFCRRPFRSSVSSLFFRALAIFDTLALNILLWEPWLRAQTKTFLVPQVEPVCKLKIYMIYLAPQLANWMLVLVAVERFVGIYMPHKVRSIFTKKREMILMAVTVVILMLINIATLPNFISIEHTYDNGETILTCGILHDDTFWMYWPWVDLALYSLIPICIMCFCNGSIVLLLCRRHRDLGVDRSGSPNTTMMTVVLIVVCSMFMICTIPFTIYAIVDVFYEELSLSYNTLAWWSM